MIKLPFVPFFATNLESRLIDESYAPPILFMVGPRTFYRLTPQVWHHLARSIHKAWHNAKDDTVRARMWAAADVLFSFVPWLDAHFTADDQARGRDLSANLPSDPHYRAIEPGRHEPE